MGKAAGKKVVKLTPSQIADGMNAAVENAERLWNDAHALFGLGSYPSASSLAILSIEESGKVSVLRGMAMAQTDQDWNERWQDYRSHKRKNYA